jgi:enoyl-CoA hydratase
MAEYRFLRMQIEGRVARLTLNCPPGNRLHIEAMEEINNALLALRDTEGADILVVRGAERVFCEGLDLREHMKDRVQRMMHVYGRIFETLRMMGVVSIAAVEGRAWGGGFELALGCNLIVAAEDASFALPEVAHGVIPPIASIVLPRVSPRRRAMEWILTGRQISAGELEHFGLVNRLFMPAQFDTALEELLDELTTKSGPVLQLAKRAQYEAYYATYEEALYKVQNMYLRELIALSDPKEGVRAHLEGRAPTWQHR